MALMDTVKQQAGQAWGKAQQGLGQGQAKFDELQAKRKAQALLRDLGAAYYAQQRQGGSDQAVRAALAAMDQHVAAHQQTDPDAGEAPSTDDTDAPADGPRTTTQIEPPDANEA
jgi:hypothetical protein